MKKTTRVIALALAAGLVLGSAPAAWSAGPSGPQGNNWASIAKLPDWSGIWDIDWSSIFGPGAPKPQLTPAYAAKLKAYTDAMKEGENTQGTSANCLPPGIPGIMAQPYPIEFLFTPGKVTMAIEAYNQMRRVYTDGRPHPADPDPLWYGHSIGHWEGDTLVVDTVGFDPHAELVPGVAHTDKMHVVEKIRKVSPEKLEITTTIEDPEVLSQPWTFTRPYIHKADDIREYICEQNNHDASDQEGRPSMKLNN